MDIGTAITTTTAALGFAKSAIGSAVSLSVDVKTREKINEALAQVGNAQEALLSVQSNLFILKTENQDLKDQIRLLKAKQDRQSEYSLVQTSGGGYVLQSKTSAASHSVCPTCVETKGEYHVLQPNGDYLNCTACKSAYRVGTKQAEAFRAVIGRRNNRI